MRPRCSRAAGPGSTGRPRPTSGGCSPTSWPACPARSTATTSRGCAACSTRYRGVSREHLRDNLARFLRAVIPAAEEVGSGWRSTPTTRRVRCSACRGSSRTPTTSPSSPGPSIARQRHHAVHGSLGAGPANDVPAIARRSPPASTSPTCATSARSRTARSWRPTTSAATPTWWRWSPCCSRSRPPARGRRAALAHPDAAGPRPRAARRRRQADASRLSGDRPPQGAGRAARGDAGVVRPARPAAVSEAAPRLAPGTLGRLPAGCARPAYDRAAVRVGIVHLGIGAFHRAHQAVYIETAWRRARPAGASSARACARPTTRMRSRRRTGSTRSAVAVPEGDALQRHRLGRRRAGRAARTRRAARRADRSGGRASSR